MKITLVFKLGALPLQSMDQVKICISTILGIVILAVSFLSALHAFDHERSAEGGQVVSENITKTVIDCDLCDFRITNAEAPAIYSYELHILQKETIYSISLAETITLFPDPLFSLRAPPAVIS